MRTLVLALFAVAGCASARAPTPPISDPRPLVTAGSRCQGGTCACREVDAMGATVGEPADDPSNDKVSSEGAVAQGQKRFELRTGRGSDDVEITVEGRGTLHKPSELINAACGYIDLPPGEHRVHVQIKGGASEGGASPKFLFYEHGEKTRSWYTTFGVTCGETGPCTDGDLQQRMTDLARAHGLFDKCGSTKIRDLHWTSHKGPDERVTSVDIDFTLKVYDFTPRFPRGGTCKGISEGGPFRPPSSGRARRGSPHRALLARSPRLALLARSPRRALLARSPRRALLARSPRLALLARSPRLALSARSPRLALSARSIDTSSDT